MKLNLLAFGIARDILNGSSLEIEIESPCSVGELKEHLFDQYPPLKELRSLAIAVNESYAKDEILLREKDEIVIIPPVSGG